MEVVLSQHVRRRNWPDSEAVGTHQQNHSESREIATAVDQALPLGAVPRPDVGTKLSRIRPLIDPDQFLTAQPHRTLGR